MAEDPSGRNPFAGFRVEFDPAHVESTLRQIRDRASDAFREGRHTKVRVSYRGAQIGPDIPLAVFLAGEGAVFWLTSPIGMLLVNLGAKALLDVEFVHEADELIQEGLDLYLKGEIEEAEAKYREALRRRPDDPAALYNLGTLLRVAGRKEEALATLRRAAMGPAGHPDAARASEAVEKMTGQRKNL